MTLSPGRQSEESKQPADKFNADLADLESRITATLVKLNAIGDTLQQARDALKNQLTDIQRRLTQLREDTAEAGFNFKQGASQASALLTDFQTQIMTANASIAKAQMTQPKLKDHADLKSFKQLLQQALERVSLKKVSAEEIKATTTTSVDLLSGKGEKVLTQDQINFSLSIGSDATFAANTENAKNLMITMETLKNKLDFWAVQNTMFNRKPDEKTLKQITGLLTIIEKDKDTISESLAAYQKAAEGVKLNPGRTLGDFSPQLTKATKDLETCKKQFFTTIDSIIKFESNHKQRSGGLLSAKVVKEPELIKQLQSFSPAQTQGQSLKAGKKS